MLLFDNQPDIQRICTFGFAYQLQVDPLADRPHPGALLEEYQGLLLAEKECMQSIRDR
jgi:hypothetical protein